ncbi:MAG: dihydroorotate dehydrogenase electron transfer subunit [Clostridiaceae bacterium]
MEKVKIYKNELIAEGIYRMVINGKFQGKPGQFYMIRAWELEPILWRPISINMINDTEIWFLYKVFGVGTNILKDLKPGDSIEINGPLGNGFNIEKGKTAIVSGGIGIAPMEYLLTKLNKEDTDLFIGFRDQPFLIDEMENMVNKVFIASENGSSGHKGYVTDILSLKDYDIIYCCGPEVMMNRVLKMAVLQNKKIYVSLEKRMACGVGACLGCAVWTKSGVKRACKEGPVFLGDDLILDEVGHGK